MQRDESIIKQLNQLGKKHDVAIKDCGNGHFQLQGKLLVNYYPFSKRRTAYVGQTTAGVQHVSPAQAIQMANKPPPVVKHSKRDERRRHYRSARKRLIRKYGAICYWCKEPLTLDTSTLDHKIPLARGGLDNENNWVLACCDCNNERGHDMPELKKPIGESQ